MIDDLRLDARFAVRSLLRTRAASAAAILTVGMGLGTAAGLFSVVNGVVLQPLPYAHADRLVTISSVHLGPDNIDAWRAALPLAEAAAAYSIGSATVTTPGGMVAARLLPAGEGLLELLGWRASAGRAFVPADHAAGANPVAMVSESFARRWLNGAAVGRTIDLDGRSHEVVGTLAEDALLRYRDLDVWVPLENAGVRGAALLARLEPGAEPATLASLLPMLAERLATPAMLARAPDARVASVNVVRARDALLLGIDGTLWLLFAAGAVVLVLAVVNVAALLVGSAVDRMDEMAMRVALGARPGRLIRQLLAEAAVLVGFGSAVALVIVSAVPRLLAVAPDILPRAHDVRLDAASTVFAVLAAATCVMFLGATSGMVVARGGRRAMGNRRSTRGRSSGLVQEVLAVVQVAAAVVLVTAGAHLLRTYLAVRPTDPGFAVDDRYVMELILSESSYPDDDAQRRLAARLLASLGAVPGVEDAAIATDLPLTGESTVLPVVAADDAALDPDRPPFVHTRAVSANYFETMDMALLRGRSLEATDAAGTAPVAVVNERTAARLWGSTVDPLGRTLTLKIGDRDLTATVVGVLRDTWVIQGPQPYPEIFLPFDQVPFRRFEVVLATRPGTPIDASRVRSALAGVDPRLPPHREIAPLSARVAWSAALPRFQSLVLGLTALTGLMLAATGCFGILSRLVAGRTRELGIRIALGARIPDVVSLVLRRVAVLAAIGILAGMLVAWMVARAMEASVHGVPPTDAVAFGAAATALLIAIAAAAAAPLRRAVRTDPTRTLREE